MLRPSLPSQPPPLSWPPPLYLPSLSRRSDSLRRRSKRSSHLPLLPIEGTTLRFPARSSVLAASAGGIGIFAIDDVADSIDALYRKDEAMAELRSEVMEALQKEVRSLDDNNWMFAAPRSRINLVSRPGFGICFSGGYLSKQQGKIAELGQAPKRTRNC